MGKGQKKKEKEKAKTAKTTKENNSKPKRGPPKPKFNKNKAKGGSNHEKEKEVKAKMLYTLPSNFTYGPIVSSEKLEVSTTKGKMELGIPTPEGKEVWKVNKELFVVSSTTNGISELERYKPKSLAKTTAATVNFLTAAKKVTTAIENRGKKVLDAIVSGIQALELGETIEREELIMLLKQVKNDISQVISPTRQEAIGGKCDQMRVEILKQEPAFMSVELTLRMANVDTMSSEHPFSQSY